MKVFLAGATGALGAQLLPRLVARGHEVIGMTRSASKTDRIRAMGGRPVVADALDRGEVAGAIAAAEPDVIVHQLTALAGGLDFRHVERTFAMTNRLRVEGTDNLLAAARASGVDRFVAQSYAGWPFARVGGPIKSETDPLDPNPPKAMRSSLDAIKHLERVVTDAGGIVLRYGGFYGPGTGLSSDPNADMVAPLRKRQFPVVGDGGGLWSFIQIEDAATATVAAIEDAPAGIYQIVDDEPAGSRDWLPVLAEAIGAPQPRHVPRWLGRLLAGEAATVMMTEARGASNAKAKSVLGWQPQYPTWRVGFVKGLG